MFPASAAGSCSSPAIGFCTHFTGAGHAAADGKAGSGIPGQVYSEVGCPVAGPVQRHVEGHVDRRVERFATP